MLSSKVHLHYSKTPAEKYFVETEIEKKVFGCRIHEIGDYDTLEEDDVTEVSCSAYGYSDSYFDTLSASYSLRQDADNDNDGFNTRTNTWYAFKLKDHCYRIS